MLALLRAHPAAGAAPPARRRWRLPSLILVGDGVPLRRSCRRASSRARTPGQIFAITEAAQGTRSTTMVAHQQRGRRHRRAATRTSTRSCRASAAAVRARVANTGRIFMRLKPRDERSSTPTRSSQELRPKLARSRASASSCRTRRRSASAAQLTKSQYQFTLQGAGHRRSSTSAAPKLVDAAARSCRASQDVTTRPADQQPAGQRRDRPRPRRGARRHAAADRGRALQRLRRAPGLDDLHAEQPVPGDPGAAARSTSAIPRRSRCSTCDRRAASSCRSSAVATLTQGVGPLT